MMRPGPLLLGVWMLPLSVTQGPTLQAQESSPDGWRAFQGSCWAWAYCWRPAS